jgi:hypothetical protein
MDSGASVSSGLLYIELSLSLPSAQNPVRPSILLVQRVFPLAARADTLGSAPFRWWRLSFFVRDRLGVFRRNHAESVLGCVHLRELCAEKEYQR